MTYPSPPFRSHALSLFSVSAPVMFGSTGLPSRPGGPFTFLPFSVVSRPRGPFPLRVLLASALRAGGLLPANLLCFSLSSHLSLRLLLAGVGLVSGELAFSFCPFTVLLWHQFPCRFLLLRSLDFLRLVEAFSPLPLVYGVSS